MPDTRIEEILRTDSIRSMGIEAVPSVAASTRLRDVITIMQKRRVAAVVVTDGGRVVGIFTERDVLLKVWGSGLDINTSPVSLVMTPNPVALKEDDILAYAIHLMAVRGFRHIPIVRDDSPVGFVSVRGILRYIADQVLVKE